jgi:hypothetical protein
MSMSDRWSIELMSLLMLALTMESKPKYFASPPIPPNSDEVRL